MTMMETQLLAPETGSNRNCGGVSSKIRPTATVSMFQTKLIYPVVSGDVAVPAKPWRKEYGI